MLVGATCLATVIGLANTADAHCLMGVPTARTSDDDLTTGPCGGIPAGDTRDYTAGDELTVRWVETIDHPGTFELHLSPGNDENFVPLAVAIPNPEGEGSYSYNITLPPQTCENCVLQLVQVMEDYDPLAYYYSCADIRIVAQDVTPDPDTGTADVGTGSDAGVEDDTGTFDAGDSVDLGSQNDNNAASSDDSSDDDGCQQMSAPSPTFPVAAVFAIGLAWCLRSRRSRTRST